MTDPVARDAAEVRDAGELYPPVTPSVRQAPPWQQQPDPTPADEARLDYARRVLRDVRLEDLAVSAYSLICAYAGQPDPFATLSAIRAVVQAEREVRAEKEAERKARSGPAPVREDRETGRFPVLGGP